MPELHSSTSAKTRVLIVDDQRVVREILRSNLEDESDLEVIGMAADGDEAIAAVERLQPDVALLDIEMPNTDGLTATRIIRERFPTTKVLLLSSYDSDEYLSRALEMGASGYLLKRGDTNKLVETIRSVHQGYFRFDATLLQKIVQQVSGTKLAESDVESIGEFLEARTSGNSRELEFAGKERVLLDRLYKSHANLQSDYQELQVRCSNLTMRLVKLEKRVARDGNFLKALIAILAVAAVAFFLISPEGGPVIPTPSPSLPPAP